MSTKKEKNKHLLNYGIMNDVVLANDNDPFIIRCFFSCYSCSNYNVHFYLGQERIVEHANRAFSYNYDNDVYSIHLKVYSHIGMSLIW